jgi:signal transduction histidine kinase
LEKGIDLHTKETFKVPRFVPTFPTPSRNQEPIKKIANLNGILQRIIELRAFHFKLNNVQVTKDLDPTFPLMLIDPYQIQQVFLNIIHHAIQSMTETQKKGSLSINTHKIGNKVRIEFSDNGPGISKDHLTEIFNPCITTDGEESGTKFDLSISYRIVKDHGGEIWAESEIGKGASFLIEFPTPTLKNYNEVKEEAYHRKNALQAAGI